MPYFVTPDDEQFMIDSAGNMFLNGKCINLKADIPTSVVEDALTIETRDCYEGIAVRVTGHVGSFEYGHTRDENGRPVCIKVCTGEQSWTEDNG